MVRKLALAGTLILSLITFNGCGDNDEPNISPTPHDAVPADVEASFAQKYPGINGHEWTQYEGYYIAQFKKSGGLVNVSAWYSDKAVWCMTHADYAKDLFMVPYALNVSFNQSPYATWTINDISLYEYPDSSNNVYVISVTSAQQESLMLVFEAGATCLYIKSMQVLTIPITPDVVI